METTNKLYCQLDSKNLFKPHLQAAVTGAGVSFGSHAAQLWKSPHPETMGSSSSIVHTEFAWKTAVSPHLAVELEGFAVP